MSTISWRGDAAAISQVSSATISGYDVLTRYTISRNGKSVSVLGVGGTVTNTAAALLALLQASLIPEFQEATWSVLAGVITATAVKPGVTFTFTSSVSGGGGTFGAFSTSVTSQGPNDLGIAANYSGGVLPTNGDDLYFSNSASPVLYNLGALSAITLNSLNLDLTYTAPIGLPRNNPSGYLEDRARYLAIGFTALNVGTGAGAGNGMWQLDGGTVQFLANVYGTGSPSTQGIPALVLKGTHASNVLNVQSGSVGVAIEPGDVSTLLALQVGFATSRPTDSTVVLGKGVTLTTVSADGGTLTLQSAATTLTSFGGTVLVTGTGAVTTVDVEQGGVITWHSTGTITTLTVGPGSTMSYDGDPRTGKIVTNATVYGTLNDTGHVVTHTNPPYFPSGLGGQGGATWNLGSNFHLQRS